MNTGPVEDHREREEGVTVYPVISRRSEGLSIGINLWTQKKVCSFNCPYCEVFDFYHDIKFSLNVMNEALRKTITHVKKDGYEIKDICFSGNGEPTISPDFIEALNASMEIRRAQAPDAEIVVITNGTGLLQKNIFDTLVKAALPPHNIKIWLKIDAGTEGWYKKINDSAVSFNELIEKIKTFADTAPFISQTMHCTVDGQEPPEDEINAWLKLVTEIAGKGNLKAVQIYGKARPSPFDPVCAEAPPESLERRAGMLEMMLDEAGIKDIKVRVFE